MAGVELVPLIDEGLGNSAYLVDLGDGRALVVDVSRDLRGVHTAASKRGLTVAFAADTHLHADFLSGAHQLGASSGAQVLASDRKSTRLNSSHVAISYAVFCLKKK